MLMCCQQFFHPAKPNTTTRQRISTPASFSSFRTLLSALEHPVAMTELSLHRQSQTTSCLAHRPPYSGPLSCYGAVQTRDSSHREAADSVSIQHQGIRAIVSVYYDCSSIQQLNTPVSVQTPSRLRFPVHSGASYGRRPAFFPGPARISWVDGVIESGHVYTHTYRETWHFSEIVLTTSRVAVAKYSAPSCCCIC